VALLLLVLCAAPSTVAAQEWDPFTTVAAYSAALNAHDVAAALALFDDNGSATDTSGRHFEGRAGLTQFLLASGFGSQDARITTQTLTVVANRAIWTFRCSCAPGPTEARLVLIHNKISVFAEMKPPARPLQRPDAGLLPWLIGLALAAATLAVALGWVRHARLAPAPIAPRASQGRLLAALALYTPGGADSDRVELPAAAMTSFSNSEESAGPWSRYRKHEAARPGSR
jgi:SnoaL-like domain